jgi:hypothetical protein
MSDPVRFEFPSSSIVSPRDRTSPQPSPRLELWQTSRGLVCFNPDARASRLRSRKDKVRHLSIFLRGIVCFDGALPAIGRLCPTWASHEVAFGILRCRYLFRFFAGRSLIRVRSTSTTSSICVCLPMLNLPYFAIYFCQQVRASRPSPSATG